MKTTRVIKPDAIVVCFSMGLLKEYPGGEKTLRRVLEMIDSLPSGHWGQTISNIPTIKVPWCYIAFGGFIQYRMNIVDFEKKVDREFNDGGIIRCFKNKNWVNLSGPTIKAPREIIWKGHQGFRYTELIF